MEFWGFENNFFLPQGPGAFLQVAGPVRPPPPPPGPIFDPLGAGRNAVRPTTSPAASVFLRGRPVAPGIATGSARGSALWSSPAEQRLAVLASQLGISVGDLRLLVESAMSLGSTEIVQGLLAGGRAEIPAEVVRAIVSQLVQTLSEYHRPVVSAALSFVPQGTIPIAEVAVVIRFAQLLTSVARAESDSRSGDLSLLLQISRSVASVGELDAVVRSFVAYRALPPEARTSVQNHVAAFISEGHEGSVPRAFEKAVLIGLRESAGRMALGNPAVQAGGSPRDAGARFALSAGGISRRVEDLSDAAHGVKWVPSGAGELFKGSPRPEAYGARLRGVPQTPREIPPGLVGSRGGSSRATPPLIARLGGSAAFAELVSLLPPSERVPWTAFLQQFTSGPAKPAGKNLSLSDAQKTQMQAFVFRLLQLPPQTASKAVDLLNRAVAHPREEVRMLVLTFLKTLARNLDQREFARLCLFPLIVLARRPRSAPEVQLTAIKVLLDTESGRGRDRRETEALLEKIALADTLRKFFKSGNPDIMTEAFSILARAWKFLSAKVRGEFSLMAQKMLANPRLNERVARATLDFMMTCCNLFDPKNRGVALRKPFDTMALGVAGRKYAGGFSHVVH